MSETLDEHALALLFTAARTHTRWTAEPLGDDVLRQLYALLRWPPTGGNGQPVRIVFARSGEAKERLRAAVDPQNVEKMMTAPVTAIVAYDATWYEHLPRLVPSRPEVRDRIAAFEPATRDALGLQSATLQAGYLIMAARALGLDCGPMGGFKPHLVDAEFFPGGEWRSILLVNLGHGDHAAAYPRAPRLAFDEACRIV